jgi:outer membrane murein-binding lipoprotein Lpp
VTLADQVADLALLVRLLLGVSVVQLVLLLAVAVRGENTRRLARTAYESSPAYLAKVVEALTASIDEMSGKIGTLTEFVEQLDRDVRAVEGEADDASSAAERALEIVREEAAAEELAFIKAQEKRRSARP